MAAYCSATACMLTGGMYFARCQRPKDGQGIQNGDRVLQLLLHRDHHAHESHL